MAGTFRCDKCGTEGLTNLAEHEQVFHPTFVATRNAAVVEPIENPCPFCPKHRFGDEEVRYQHVRQVHGEEYEKELREKEGQDRVATAEADKRREQRATKANVKAEKQESRDSARARVKDEETRVGVQQRAAKEQDAERLARESAEAERVNVTVHNREDKK